MSNIKYAWKQSNDVFPRIVQEMDVGTDWNSSEHASVADSDEIVFKFW